MNTVLPLSIENVSEETESVTYKNKFNFANLMEKELDVLCGELG